MGKPDQRTPKTSLEIWVSRVVETEGKQREMMQEERRMSEAGSKGC